MKKFLLSLLACFAAVAANAWTVQFTNPKGWAEVAVYTFNPETEGGWPGKLMTKNGDVWTYTGSGNPANIIFNNNNKGAQTGDLKLVDGATYDFYGPVGAQLNDYTVYFDNSKSNWSNVYVYTFSPEGAGAWPGTQLSQNAQGLYEWTYKAVDTPTFGGIIFNDGAGTQTGDLTYKVGETYTADGSSNPGDNGEMWVNLGGSFNDYNFYDGGVQPVDGVATFTNAAIGTKGFKIKTWDGSADQYYIADGMTEVPVDTWVLFAIDTFDIENYVADASENSVYNVEFNVNTLEVRITKVGGDDPIIPTPDPTFPDKLYMMGNIEGFNWATDKGLEAVNNEGVYQWNAVNVDGGMNNEGYINFSTVLGEDWDTVNGGNRYGALSQDEPLESGEAGTVILYAANVDASGCLSWMLDAGRYDITIDLNTMTIMAEQYTETSVEAIEAADADAVYYNLQGARVANPDKGIYIKVANGKAVKVIK